MTDFENIPNADNNESSRGRKAKAEKDDQKADPHPSD